MIHMYSSFYYTNYTYIGESYNVPDANGPQKNTHQGREFVLPTSHSYSSYTLKMNMSTCKYEYYSIIS